MVFLRKIEHCLLSAVLLVSAVLLFYRLNDLTPFIGDQAWFYLSARDLWLKGQIPLVGITASHTWLHQGPLWTYIVAILLPLGKFNPVIPAYFTVMVTLLTSIILYLIGKKVLSTQTALIATALFATSPLVIMSARMPYHTTLIPLFSLLLYYFLYLWLSGSKKIFPYIFLLLGILYNLELATVMLWFIPIVLLVYGWYKKKSWYKSVATKKTALYSLLAVFVPLFPVIVYDTKTGFHQTVIFAGWILYRMVHFLLPVNTTHQEHSYQEILRFLFQENGRLVLGVSPLFASLFSTSAIIVGILQLKKKYSLSLLLLVIFCLLLLAGFITNKTPSSAYLPLFFPFIFLLIGNLFSSFARSLQTKLAVGFMIVIILVMNSWYLLLNNYFVDISLGQRITLSKKIVSLAKGRPFTIDVRWDNPAPYETKSSNTEYLTWWLGGKPTHPPQRLNFIVNETSGKLSLYMRDEK